MTIHIPSLAIIIGFTCIHFFSKFLTFQKVSLRKFVSFSGGVGIAYVFIHLLPQLERGQRLLEQEFQLSGGFAHYTIYLVALFGLVLFYTIDRLIYRAWERDELQNPDVVDSNLFWSDMGLFVLYNSMIGYLVALAGQESTPRTLIIYFIAFSLHFTTNDWSLRHHHRNAYDAYGRMLLSLGILFGYFFGEFYQLPAYVIGMIESFVTGAMILNVIKYELPSEREGSLEGFLTGVISASILFFLL